MSNTNEYGAIVANYIDKYVDAKYTAAMKNYNNQSDISELQWNVIIDQAWQMAYKKALADASLTLEEKNELNNIYALKKAYNPATLTLINYKILNTFKKLSEIDKKETIEDKYEAKNNSSLQEKDKKRWKPAYPKLVPENQKK